MIIVVVFVVEEEEEESLKKDQIEILCRNTEDDSPIDRIMQLVTLSETRNLKWFFVKQ